MPIRGWITKIAENPTSYSVVTHTSNAQQLEINQKKKTTLTISEKDLKSEMASEEGGYKGVKGFWSLDSTTRQSRRTISHRPERKAHETKTLNILK